MQKAGFLTAFWALAKPYWVSEQRTKGLVLLVAVVGLSLGAVYLEVQFNTWTREMYNTFETRDQAEFYRQMGTFTLLAVIYIIVGVYRVYFQQILPLLIRIGTRSPDARLLMTYYWDTIDECVPAAMILAALQQAGFVDVQHSLRGACLSEYVARKPT